MALNVGGVDLVNVLIEPRATCNQKGQQTWNGLKTKGIQCKSHNCDEVLFPKKVRKLLPFLGMFSKTVLSLCRKPTIKSILLYWRVMDTVKVGNC